MRGDSGDFTERQARRRLAMLIERLHSRWKYSSVERREAAIELGNFQQPEAASALIQALTDSDVSIRRAAEQSLQKIGKVATRQLIAALEHESPFVRRGAALALGTAQDAKAFKSLERVLMRDEEWGVRAAAAETLGRMGDRRAVRMLIEALLDDESAEVRQAAATALGEIGDPKALKPLDQALRDSEPRVRMAADAAVKRIVQRM